MKTNMAFDEQIKNLEKLFKAIDNENCTIEDKGNLVLLLAAYKIGYNTGINKLSA